MMVLLAVTASGCSDRAPSENDSASNDAANTTAGERRNVLLITLDTTRADALGCYGNEKAATPSLDALAERGLLFERAFTPVPITLPAHASILTGVTPLRHGVHLNASFDLDPNVPTLAETLTESGYVTGAVIGAFPLIARFHLDRGFATYDEEFPLVPVPSSEGGRAQVRHHERSAGAVVDTALQWLDARTEEAPWFLWCHFFDPHDPYLPPPPFNKGGLKEHYAGEVAYMDQEIGRLFDHLKTKTSLDDTLIVVVGDHGESLGEHDEKTHSYFLYDSTVRVPLIIGGPEIPARRIRDGVGIIDVLPTITELVGVKHPDVDGVSLVPYVKSAAERETRALYAETLLPSHEYGFAPLFSVRFANWKYVHAPIPELYDTDVDPRELNNLARGEPGRIERLRDHLEKTMAGSSPTTGAQTMDEELRARLATLGYARLGAPLAPNGQPRKDPKEMVKLYERLQAASELGKTGRITDAITRLEEISPEFEWSFVHRLELGSLYYMQGQKQLQRRDRDGAFRWFRKARERFEAVLELEPTFLNAILNVGNIAYLERDYEAAMQALEKVIAMDPQKWEAYLPLCGCIQATGGDVARVAELLEKLLTLDVPPQVRQRAENALKQTNAKQKTP